jgi:hypothetical protein
MSAGDKLYATGQTHIALMQAQSLDEVAALLLPK